MLIWPYLALMRVVVVRIASVFRPFLFIIYFFWDKTFKSNTFTYPCSQNIPELYRHWCHQKSVHGTSLLPNHNELYRGNYDPSNTFGSFALKSCRVWFHPWNPYTRYTVLDHYLCKQLGKHCIKHEKKCFFPIFKHREVIYQTREGGFHPISKHREVKYQTRKGVFQSDIQTTRSDKSNTRRSDSSDTYTPRSYIKHKKKCFSDIQTPGNEFEKRGQVLSTNYSRCTLYWIVHT